MGLTYSSTGKAVTEISFRIEKKSSSDKIIALAGNPNVGKSTVFNSLTGLNQHTGNWPGKTVASAQGTYKYKDTNFILVDIPGTYSLMANSVEEEISRDFICFGNPNGIIVVVDATNIERNLNLVLQTIEINKNVVVCVNLMDEAKRKGIYIDLKALSKELGIPVVGTCALKGEGLEDLMNSVYDLTVKNSKTSPITTVYDENIEAAIKLIEGALPDVGLNAKWLALRILENDTSLIESINRYLGYDILEFNEVVNKRDLAIKYLKEKNISVSELRDMIVSRLIRMGENIALKVVKYERTEYNRFDRRVDKILTSRVFGFPVMLALLGLIFWITISGANLPSEMLSSLLFGIEDDLINLFKNAGAPPWLYGLLISGMYRTLAWVVSVMLPPMAIFFPLFTLLEDLGYLPRVAFNLDNFFKKCSACGKQALSMCMGFGCNAAGVVGCRIIDSPRERLIAVITNNFVPCNGRFPILISIIIMFFAGGLIGPVKSIASALLLLAAIVIGIIMTFLISKLLSATILKGIPSTFTLELPPYRKPQVGRIIIRSIFDRTLFVLGRAVRVAAPAGIIIWIMANLYVGDMSILSICSEFLDPFGRLIGLDGVIVMAFILGFPANEIVIPIIIMSYMATGTMIELDSLESLRQLLLSNGWTMVTAICMMLFTIMHWPCGTTLLTIKKETGSLKWTLVSLLVPTLSGIIICFLVASGARLFKLVF